MPQADMESPSFHSEIIFPYQSSHVHAASVVELPDGSLLACWFEGSGERQADDVMIKGARKPGPGRPWTAPFLMADVPGFPDCNPVLFLDPARRLWLMWVVIVANRWETAMLKYRISEDFLAPDGPPRWCWQDVIHCKPEGFAEAVERKLAEYVARYRSDGAEDRAAALRERAADRYFQRMGWMTRNPPLVLGARQWIVPLYSDGYSFSMMAITEDGGQTWTFSEPLVGFGNIQPSLIRKRDGTIVAYMRDNGPPPKRLHVSTSSDGGRTWSPVEDTNLPNPGSSAGVLALPDGHWLLVYNDLERGRTRLAASISQDEGRTWPWTRCIESDPREETGATSHYPTVILAREGDVHLVYSHHRRDRPDAGKTIKYARFNAAWVKGG
ncbi:MAG TPA: exo-alpha-sialidase [Limnochordia bacterium]